MRMPRHLRLRDLKLALARRPAMELESDPRASGVVDDLRFHDLRH